MRCHQSCGLHFHMRRIPGIDSRQRPVSGIRLARNQVGGPGSVLRSPGVRPFLRRRAVVVVYEYRCGPRQHLVRMGVRDRQVVHRGVPGGDGDSGDLEPCAGGRGEPMAW